MENEVPDLMGIVLDCRQLHNKDMGRSGVRGEKQREQQAQRPLERPLLGMFEKEATGTVG